MLGIFHLVVNTLPGSTGPPQSPFVLAPSVVTPPFVRRSASWTLTGDPKDVSNPLVLRSPSGKALLTLKTAVSDGSSTTFTFDSRSAGSFLRQWQREREPCRPAHAHLRQTGRQQRNYMHSYAFPTRTEARHIRMNHPCCFLFPRNSIAA
jgi:hypothetical protein